MQIVVIPQGVRAYPVRDLDLDQTLDCGQSFRWERQPDGSYTGVAMGRLIQVALEGETLTLLHTTPEEFETLWRSYFDLDLDYGLLRQRLSGLHPVLSQAAGYAPGMRLLNQEPWEALCSFIISQNNNIPRIKGIISRLCACFGAPLAAGGFAFPTAARLAACTLEELQPLRSGFRAKYLLDAAQRVAAGELDLQLVKTLPLEEARAALMTVQGVGPKVAECVLLYGMHRLECFPMDVWMKRAMAALFPGKEPSFFGPYAGLAQQYIFHYSRMHPELFREEQAQKPRDGAKGKKRAKTA